MALPPQAGVPFHGEFSSADASALTEANSRFNLYGQSSTSALTLGANDIVQIASASVASAGTNLTVTIYDGADATPGAGEVAVKAICPTNNTIAPYFGIPHFCQKGTYPKVKASAAGQVDVQIRGTIYRHAA